MIDLSGLSDETLALVNFQKKSVATVSLEEFADDLSLSVAIEKVLRQKPDDLPELPESWEWKAIGQNVPLDLVYFDSTSAQVVIYWRAVRS